MPRERTERNPRWEPGRRLRELPTVRAHHPRTLAGARAARREPAQTHARPRAAPPPARRTRRCSRDFPGATVLLPPPATVFLGIAASHGPDPGRSIRLVPRARSIRTRSPADSAVPPGATYAP